jgi:hypothetical protein
MVERVYSLLQPYVLHVNEAVGASALAIASTPPDEILETTDGDWPVQPPHEVSYYRARFSTHSLSIVIRGAEDRVDFFVLPADQIMRLSKAEDAFGPLMTFKASLDSGNVVWEVEDKPLTDERFERYCLLLLDYFMKQTQEELARAS